MHKMLVTIFNDRNQDLSYSLDQAIKALPGIEKLKQQPIVRNYEIGQEIVAVFSQMRLISTLFFVDPWGYKGLTLQLINSVLKDWGCDAILFFNYNRINMGLSNPAVQEHMNALFTEKRAAILRKRLERLSPAEREFTIVEEIAKALMELGTEYVLPFCFKNEDYTCRIDHLRQTPAKIKFLSLEPLLGPLRSLNLENIQWVIVGGESGPGARRIEVSWVIDIRNQCRAAGVPFFFKQWGGVNKKRTGRELEGRTWDEMPLPLIRNERLQETLFDAYL